MPNGNSNFNVHPKVWKDWKIIAKHHKSKEFQSFLSGELGGISDDIRLDSIPQLKAIRNSITNATAILQLESIANPYDRQPFLSLGWKVYKMRWGIDNKGKSSGLRIIFCTNKENILLIFIATKNDCATETKLEKEFFARIKDYLSWFTLCDPIENRTLVIWMKTRCPNH